MTSRRRGPLTSACLLLTSACLLLTAACGGASVEADATDHKTVGVLRAVSATAPQDAEQYLRDELRLAGFIEGGNLTILPARGDEVYPDPEDAARAVARWRARGLDLVLALSSDGAAAARRAAPDVPVLFISNDPVATGLVDDERQPESLLSGVTFRTPADRTLVLSRRVLPDLEVIGLAHPRDDPAARAHRDSVGRAARALGMTLVTEEFSGPEGVAAAVDRLVERGMQALLLSTSPDAVLALEETEAAVSRHRLPVIANTHLAEFALVSLYPDSAEVQRQLGRQAARLLAGTSPSAIPVEDPRRFLTRLDATIAADLGVSLTEEVLREVNEVVQR